MKKELIRDLVIILIISTGAFAMGYYRAKYEVIQKALNDKKDCYNLIDIYQITK